MRHMHAEHLWPPWNDKDDPTAEEAALAKERWVLDVLKWGSTELARRAHEVAGLKDRVAALETAIVRVVEQQADDICWIDVLRDLAALVGRRFEPALLPPEQFAANCERYRRSVYDGLPYERDALSQLVLDLMRERDAVVAWLRDRAEEHRETASKSANAMTTQESDRAHYCERLAAKVAAGEHRPQKS